MANRVVYGIKNVHYAVATYDTVTGSVTYDTPKPLPGAVELSLEPRGDMAQFYADNTLYFSAQNNQGYEGTLSIALIPEDFLVDCLGEVKDETDGVVSENANAKGKPFALLFEFEGDEKAVRHALYYCTANRPTLAQSTATDTIEPQSSELSFTAAPRPSDGLVKAKTSADTNATVYDGWYSAVYEPGSGGGA